MFCLTNIYRIRYIFLFILFIISITIIYDKCYQCLAARQNISHARLNNFSVAFGIIGLSAEQGFAQAIKASLQFASVIGASPT